MTKTNQALGEWGEGKAAEYLEGIGYQILERNFRTPYGEIDLIAQINSEIIFVEVKTRSSRNFGYPEEAITAKKMQHMIESAESYMQEQEDQQKDWRIDVIAIEKPKDVSKPLIEHFENISG